MKKTCTLLFALCAVLFTPLAIACEGHGDQPSVQDQVTDKTPVQAEVK